MFSACPIEKYWNYGHFSENTVVLAILTPTLRITDLPLSATEITDGWQHCSSTTTGIFLETSFKYQNEHKNLFEGTIFAQ